MSKFVGSVQPHHFVSDGAKVVDIFSPLWEKSFWGRKTSASYIHVYVDEPFLEDVCFAQHVVNVQHGMNMHTDSWCGHDDNAISLQLPPTDQLNVGAVQQKTGKNFINGKPY